MNYARQYLGRLGDLCGDVEMSLFKVLRSSNHGQPMQAGKYYIELQQMDNGNQGVFINGTHVLKCDVAMAIDALDTLEQTVNPYSND